MGSRLALLCPGQGGQGPAMFELARGDAQAGALLDAWLVQAGLGMPVDTVLSDAHLLFSNRMAQPLIAAATLATWTALGEAVARPAIVAGYSLGELVAYGVAGSLDPGELVRVAGQRAALMNACTDGAPPQALVAISSLPVDAAAAIAGRFGFHRSIENGEDSLVVGGPAAEREALEQAVLAAGGRVTVLPVELASHTPFLQGAVAPFATLLRGERFLDPQLPVISGIAAEPVHDAGKAIEHLARQLAEPIRWKDCMDALAEAGTTVALELGPGAALTRMLQARHPHIACRSVADFRSLDGVRAWLARHVE